MKLHRSRYSSSSSATHQRGVALVMSLIFLVVLTIIGITSMRNTTLQERMAGAMRDQGLAFQAAEAALREGEDYVRALSKPIALNDPNNGLYHWQNHPAPDLENVNWRTVSTTQPEAAAQPSYIIEQLGTSAGGSAVATDSVVESLIADEDFAKQQGQLFRITARAVGGSSSASVTLQSTYRP